MIGHICAVDRVILIPYMQKPTINQVREKPYSLGRQPISQISFRVIARSKTILLGRQQVFACMVCE